MATEGIAKRATIGVGFHTNQEAINAFEHSLRTIGEDTGKLRNTFNRTNLAMDRFNEHIEQLTGHNSEAMDRLREADNKAVESTHHVSDAIRNSADTYNHNANQFTEADRKIIESERDKYEHLANNEHLINERLSKTATNARHTEDDQAQQIKRMQSRLHSMGNTSEHTGNRMATANGRVARSFRYSSSAIGRHEQAIRDAQSHSYRWLRTAQDMSGATLGLGAAFYKGAKDATTLQQSYIHAGNMAHYGGERMSRVQHDINQQWRVGSNLSVKYGISQDQIAKGYQALVARGYTTNESLHTQKSLLQAAIASGDDYNDVVKDSTNVLDAYNMRSQNAATMTNNTKRVVNEMAYAADQTATNFQGLGIGMSYVAATAHTTHQSISETSSALGILSNKGMQASQAGVGLRKVLNSFLSVNKKGQQAQVMQQLGLNESDFKTASGHLKSLGSLMSLLNDKTKNMDSQERGAVFHRFFGATGQEAALNLASDTSGLAKLNKQVEKSQTMGSKQQGYVALLSQHNMKSAQNQFNKFKQAWQAFTITAAREILPDFTGALKHLDVYLAKLNDLSPRAKKWTIFGALAVAALAPIAGVIFGIQSAFHALEMTMLHIRHIFSKPVSSNMNKSMLKQDAEDQAGADLTKDGSSTGALSRVAKYDKGGIGYRALSLVKDHPTGAGITSAGALALGMGTFMGLTANREATNQTRNQFQKQMRQQHVNPIQEQVKMAFDSASARQSLESSGKFNKQLLNQNKSTYSAMQNNLKNYSKRNESQSAKNLQTLRKYGLLSKKQVANRLRYDQNADKSKFKTANNAIRAISRDETRFNSKGYQNQIHSQKNALDNDKKHYRDLQSLELSATGKRRKSIQKQLSGILSDEKKHSRSLTALQYQSENQRKNDLNRAQNAIDKIIAGNGSRANKIYKQLQHSNNRISTQTAAKLLRNAYRTSRGEISSANREYNSTKSAAWKKYNTVTKAAAEEYGTTSRKYKAIRSSAARTRDSTIKSANTQRKMTVQAATEEHNKIVQEAESQCKGISSAVDVGTGHVITEWDKMDSWLHHIGSDIKGVVHSVGSALNNLTGGIAGKLSNVMSDIGSAASKAGSFGHAHASGGAIGHTEMSLVNEKGQESAYNPNTNSFRLLGNNGPQVLKLYAGEHVLDAQDTRELLTTGLGRGVTLPGYANGTDKLGNLRSIHGYVNGRGEAIAQSAMHNGKGGENTFNGLKDAESDFNPYSWAYTVPHDIAGNGPMLHKATSVATDLPVDKFGHAAKGLKALHISKNLVKPLTLSAHAIKRPLEGLRSLHRLTHPLSSSLDLMKNHVHSFAKSLGHMIDPSEVNKNFKKIAPMLHKGIDLGLSKAKSALHNGFNYVVNNSRQLGNNIRRIGHRIASDSGKIWRNGVSKLRKFGQATSRFSRRTWSNAKRLGRRLWTNTKHVAGKIWSSTKRTASRMWSTTKRTANRMWNSAKRTGKNIWSNAKRIASDVGKTASSLWSRTKSGAARTWSRVVSGARRMASNIKSKVSSMVSTAKSKAESAWSTIKSGASAAVSRAKSLIDGLKNAASEAASWIESKLSHIHMPHFANGGPIQRSTMALVGEHGPETAYDPRSGSVRLLGLHGPQITELLAGERVLTNTQTSRLLHGGIGSGTKLPAFAKGTGESLSNVSSKSSVMGIVGSFNGLSALRGMLKFGKKSKSIWSLISDNVVKAVSDAREQGGQEWQGMSKDIGDINDKMSKDTNSSFKDMSDKISHIVSDLSDGLVDAARGTASGFGDKFSKLIDYAQSDIKQVISAINKGISGIDTALESFGGNSHVIHEIHYAKGTMNGRIAYPQMGILNDATQGPKQEAILRGDQIMFPQGHDVSVPLQRGDAVLNGEQTKQLINNTTVNHYASGSGIHLSDKLIKNMTSLLGKAIKSPVSTFDKLAGSAFKPSGHPFTRGLESMIARPTIKLGGPWIKAMFNFIKSLFSSDNSSSGGSSTSMLLNEMHKLGDGHTYLWGAAGPTHYDCGGLVMAALHHLGMPSEHTVYPYPRIPAKDATTGDIVQSATHVGVVADPHAKTYFSAYGPNLAKDSIKTQPLTNEYFTPGHPYYFRRPWKLYHEDQRRMAEKSHPQSSSRGLNSLVQRELGSPAIKWLKAAASIISDGGGVGAGAVDSTRIPGAPGSWTKRGTQANNIARDVFSSAKALGLDNKHAAAMVGNAWHESAGFEYGLKVNQFNGGGGKGLFQFTGQPSKYGWSPYAQDKSILSNATPAAESGWKHEDASTYKLAEDFETIFERGSIPAYAARAEAADKAYDMFAANGGWADKSHMRIFGEAGPEVAINPTRDTADSLIVQAIGARMQHNPNSPISGLVKSLGIRNKAKSLANDIKNLITGSANPKPKQHNNKIDIHLSIGNINIAGNPSHQQATNLTHNIEKLVERGIQKAALRSRNRLDW